MKLVAVILAGGNQTRFGLLGSDISKALVPIDGVPLLSLLVRWVSRHVDSVRVASGERSDVREVAIAEGAVAVSGVAAGTAWGAFEALDGLEYDEALLLNADTINDLHMPRLIGSFRATGKPSMLAVTRYAHAKNKTNYTIDSECCVVHSAEASPVVPMPNFGSGYWRAANTGTLLVRRNELVQSAKKRHLSIEADVIPLLIAERKLVAYDNGERLCIDIGTEEGCASLQRAEAVVKDIFARQLVEQS